MKALLQWHSSQFVCKYLHNYKLLSTCSRVRADSVYVRAGRHNIDVFEATQQLRYVNQIVIHPEYVYVRSPFTWVFGEFSVKSGKRHYLYPGATISWKT